MKNINFLTRWGGKETSNSWKRVTQVSLTLVTLLIFTCAHAWGGTTAPTGSAHTPGSVANADLVTFAGKKYEVYFSNNASTSSLLVGSNTSSTTQATSTTGWCNIGSSCGNNNNNISTAFTLDEFVSNVKNSNNKAIRVQSTGASERNIVMVVSGYDSISVFAKSNDISVYAEIWGGSSYGDASALTLGHTKSGSSHYKRQFALDNTKQYRLTIAYGTSGSTNKDLVAFSLCYTPASCASNPADPGGLAVGSITADGGTFTITDDANTNNYEIVCKTSSGAPAADATPTQTGTSKTIAVTGLSDGTTYYAFVRSVCDGSHKSSWVALGSSTFTTKSCSISSCGNATLTYPIYTAGDLTTSNIFTGATSSNTTAVTVGASPSVVGVTISSATKGSSATAGACYAKSTALTGKLQYSTASLSSSYYIDFPFTVQAGYTFTPCDVQVVIQPVSTDQTFTVKITDGTNDYGASAATTLTAGVAAPIIGLTGTSAMSAGTYNIRLYPHGGTSKEFRMGASVILKGTTAAAACTAPSSVTVTPTNANGWRYSIGETIDMTCTATGGSGGSYTYQWQKYVGSAWTDINKATNATAGTSNLKITNCASTDGGSYRCVVSTGAGCELASDGYFIRVFTLNGNYSGSGFSENAIVWSDANTGVATVNLNASSIYEFKVYDNDGKIFGNGANNYIIQPVNWDCGTDNSNCRLLTGPAGDYTFTINISHAADNSPYVNVQVGYPSVSHPSTGYMYITKWWDHCYVHYWEGTNNALSVWGYDPEISSDRYVDICGTNYWYFPVVGTYNKFIAKDAAGDPSNTTGDQVSTDHGGMYITHNGVSWVWNDFSTYTITYAANGGGSSMSPTSGICPDANQAITSNAFTAPTGCASFSHWKADVNVKVGGATVTAGDPIADGATIQNINSNITLTAVWKLSAPTITDGGDNTFTISGSMAGSSYYYTTNNSTPTTSSSLYSSAVDFSAGEADITAKAIAHKTGYVDSDPASQACTYHAPDPCSEPDEVTNEIARFFVPCGLSNATSGSPTAWNVTNQDASTEDNTFTTSGFGGGSSNWYRNATSGLIYGKLSGDASYIQLKLKSGNFQAGDVVTIYINRNNATKTSLKLKSTSGNEISIGSTASGVETSGSRNLVAADIEADGSIKLFRAGSSTFVNRIIVTRPACTNVSISTQPTSPVAATVDEACSISGLVAAGTSPTYQWYTCNSDGSSATAINAAGAMSFTGYTTATLGMTPTAAGATYYKCVVSGSCGDPVTSNVVTVNASAAPASALITYNLNVGTSASTTIKSSTSTTDGTNITNIDIDQTNDGADGAGAAGGGSTTDEARSTKLAIKTGANGADWAGDPTNYEIFKFKVACGKKMTPSRIRMKVANVGSASANNIKYKAVLSDTYGHSLSGTYVVTTQDGTVETFDIDNADASKYFQGEVTLKLWAWTIASKDNGGSAFRMGTPVEIFGEVGNQATPAATITWTTQPANGQVGDPDFAYAVSCSDGSTVTVTSANTTYATIVGGKLHYASAGTTHLVASATDACGNTVTPVNSNDFTVSAAAVTHDVTFSLTNVVYSSGDNQGIGAATEGSEFSTVFAASSGYSLPGTITVTIGGVEQTVGTGYTWAQGTGTLTIPAAYVTDDIVVTIAGDEMEGDGCDELVHTEAATATTLTTSVGTATLSSPSSQTANDKAIKLNSSGYIELSPKAGKSFAAGDSLIIVMWNQASSAKTTGYRIAGTDYTASMPSKVNTTFRRKLIAADIVSSKVKIERESANGSNAYFVSAIIKHCEDLDACTTPTLPTLSNQTVCPGSDIAAWDATVTNAATISAAGESVAYSWKKKGNDDELATTASYDLGSSATEGQAGTYVVTATVSKTGRISKSASKEVTLTVTPATEEPSVSSNKATVYAGNSVTLTATCGSSGTITWAWYTCTNAAGDGESVIAGQTTNAYAIASAPAAGTYYYKVKATGDGTNACGTASHVYTLTVSEASGECNMMTIFDGSTMSSAPASTSGSEATSGATWSLVGTATEMSGTVSMEYSGKTYTKGWKFTGGATTTTSRYIQIVIPSGYTGDLVMNGFIGSTSRSVFVATSPTGTLNTSIAYWSPATTNTLATATTRLSAGTYYVCATNSAFLAELSVNVCGDEVCSDEKPTTTAVNNTVCVGSKMRIDATGYEAGATFQWQKKNGSSWDNVAGATLDSLVIASVVAGDAGTYRVQATKGCTRNSNEVTITVPSAPVFGAVPSSVSVMQTLALSITTVEASDAVKYRWYKSADATWDAGDAEICDTKNLLKAYDGEAVASPAYYVFCRAQNSCGITTSSAIAVNVTAYVAEDCAEKGNEGEAQFGFENTSCSQGTYSETSVWTSNSRSKYLTYTAPEGKYLKTAKVTVAVSSGSKCGYAYSTNSGSTWTYAELSSLSSTLTEKTIDLSGSNVTDFRISRNLQDGSSKDWGVTSGTFYLSKACFEYNEACTSTTVTPSTASTSYTIGGAWSNPTFSLTPAAVSGETLTYTSSNEDIATVDDDGMVTFQGPAGTVTITASYAGGTVAAVDYCASSGSYTITVSCSDEAPKIVPGGTVNMSGCNSSVTLNAKMQNGTSDFSPAGTYQWYRDGEAISGATSKSYTAVQAGIYTVERTGTGGCTNLSSNSATVTSETVEPEVEHLAPFQYYHVDKTYSAQMKMRHLFAVKNSKKVDGKSFKLYVSRNGGVATDVTSSNALAVWSNADGRVDTVMVDLNKLNGKYAEDDELVFTCKAIDCEDNVSDVYKDSITMHVIDQTPTLALILNGAGSVVGGDFLEDYEPKNLQEQTGSKTWSGEWPMYTDLKTAYNVTPVNGYAPFNKLNYEPFDIIFLTDFPKASKSDATKALLDDMYDLVDFRPMFSFKTHMLWVNPSKWAAKGFTAAPVVPKGGDGRTNMNIVCYAHPMFEEITTGEDVYRDNSDNSQLVYKMLDSTGYENSKGIQGFEIEAAENFVTIGLIHHNADATPNSPTTGKISWSANSGDRMLVAAAERQANLEARMIILSLNAGAHSKLTEKGRAVVMKSLEYLISDAADPLTPAADCSFTFDNAAGDGNWNTAGNWGPDHNVVPGQFTSVRIAAPVTVNVEHAHVMEARIVEGGSITIPAGKGLEVTSTIRHMDGAEISPTEISELTLEASASSNGTLIFNNNTGDTKATVWAYSKGYIDHTDPAKEPKGVKNYQYIGTPFNAVNAAYNYYGSWIYYWKEDGSGWKSLKNGASMTAWTGYCITQETPTYYETSGAMTATGTVDIPVPADANMVVSNSWTAPIDINALTTDDLEGLTGNIYFFNTGVDKTGEGGAAGGDRYAGGTYVTVPVNSAPYSGDDHINSMQGFFVKNTGGSAGTLHLDYDRHVRGTTRGSIIGDALHAPARRAALNSNDPEVLKIKVSGENYDDKLLLLAREDFSTGFDNGWDGDKWDGNASALYLYTTDDEGTENSVSAIPEMEGTVIGFRAGEDEAAYTLHFEYLNGYETLYLYDTQLNTYTEIKTGATYRFFTSDKEKHARFIITRRIPQTETGIEDVESGKWKAEGARKLLIEDKMYIMINGLLYDATGKVVK